MMKPSIGGNGSGAPITIYHDHTITITLTPPYARWQMKTNGDWEGASADAYSLNFTNNSNYTVTVTALSLELKEAEPHGGSYNANMDNFRVKWDSSDTPTLTVVDRSNPITLTPQGGGSSTTQEDADKVDWWVNQAAGATADLFVKATLSYNVTGGVSDAKSPDSTGAPTGYGQLGPWAQI